MMSKRSSGQRFDGEQLALLRAFHALTPEQRLTWSSITAELMLRTNPELLAQRRRVFRDSSQPLPKPSWRLRIRTVKGKRQLEIYEVDDR